MVELFVILRSNGDNALLQNIIMNTEDKMYIFHQEVPIESEIEHKIKLNHYNDNS